MAEPTHAIDLVRLAEKEIESLRGRLLDHYGWAGPALGVRFEGGCGVLAGSAVSGRSIALLLGCLREKTPGVRWVSQITPLRGERHRGIVGETIRLTEGACGPAQERLATEWHRQMGSLEVLAEPQSLPERTLVRARDGTVGWVNTSELGADAEAETRVELRGDWASCEQCVRGFFDVPYLLGGTTRRGVDCTGLVQTAFFHTIGVLLPRHSTDQLAFVEEASAGDAEPGDLVFSWTKREGPCHVGIVVGQGREVVHASVSRQRVVVDPMGRFFVDSTRRAHLRHKEILTRASERVGAPRDLLGWDNRG